MSPALKIRQKIIYDDSCGICRQFRKLAEKRDPNNLFEFISNREVDPDDFSPHPMPANVVDNLTMVDRDGQLYRGARAVSKILIHFNGYWRAIGRLLSWPAIAFVADAFYHIVACRRHDISRGLKMQ